MSAEKGPDGNDETKTDADQPAELGLDELEKVDGGMTAQFATATRTATRFGSILDSKSITALNTKK